MSIVESSTDGIPLAAARVAAGLTVIAGLAAVAVHALVASPARGSLQFRFPAVPARFGDALVIFAENGRALAGVFGLLLVAQLAVRRSGGPSPAQTVVIAIGELILAGLVLANTVRVGVAVGAYGTRMVDAMLPHGPVELGAFATALALYLRGRSRPLPTRRILITGTASVALLAVAAALETFVQ